jgi:hypothetical protein
VKRIRLFRRAYRGGWEANYVGKRWNLRIARYQGALWKDMVPVFNFIDAGV